MSIKLPGSPAGSGTAVKLTDAQLVVLLEFAMRLAAEAMLRPHVHFRSPLADILLNHGYYNCHTMVAIALSNAFEAMKEQIE